MVGLEFWNLSDLMDYDVDRDFDKNVGVYGGLEREWMLCVIYEIFMDNGVIRRFIIVDDSLWNLRRYKNWCYDEKVIVIKCFLEKFEKVLSRKKYLC